MSEVRKEIINRLTKLVDQRKNLAGEIKYDNCIVSTTDLDFLLNMINEDSYIAKEKIKDKIKKLEEKMKYENNEKILVYLHKQRKILRELLEDK